MFALLSQKKPLARDVWAHLYCESDYFVLRPDNNIYSDEIEVSLARGWGTKIEIQV